MKLFGRTKKVVNENERKSSNLYDDTSLKQTKFKVTGTKYYEKNILKLGEKNSYYSKVTKKNLESQGNIYKYIFNDSYQVDLINDTDNHVNPYAIKVLFNGIHVGYIKDGSLTRVRNLLKDSYSLYGKIKSGPHKTLSLKNGNIFIEEETSPLKCDIYFLTKK